MLYKFGERTPQLNGDNHYIAENATVIGSVVLEDNVSVWFNVVIRGDNDVIHIGERTNIQDNAVIHTDPDTPMSIGKGVTVGHKATLHGCTVGDNSVIGIGAVVLNNAVIGKNCVIGSNALIKENQKIPDGSLVVGTPGKVIRELSEEQIKKLPWFSDHYVEKIQRYKDELVRIDK